MKNMKRSICLLIAALLLMQSLICVVCAIDGAGFSGVTAQSSLAEQKVYITGAVQDPNRQLTVIIRRNGSVLYLNQFESNENGDFSLVIPTGSKLAEGDNLTVSLGGASSGNLELTFAAGGSTGSGSDPVNPPVGPSDPVNPPVVPSNPVNPPVVPSNPVNPPLGPTDERQTGTDASDLLLRWVNPFVDVQQGHWFYEAVEFACSNDLFNGVDALHFGPGKPMTRAMLVTVLHRLAGKPAGGESTFTDVKGGIWYSEAVAWASASGVVGGVGGGRFAPERNVTREQLAAILYRYAQNRGYDVSADAALTEFADASLVSGYAVSAMRWASGAGILSGKSGNRLDPQGNATRAEVAMILLRFSERFGR